MPTRAYLDVTQPICDVNSMTEEEKKAAEEAAAAEAEAKKAEEEAEKDPLQPDYEEIAKAEKQRDEERKEKAKLAFEEREKKRKEKEAGGSAEDKPLTETRLQEILEQDRMERKKESQEIQARDMAKRLTTSASEAEAAFLFWKNRVIPSGNLDEDVRLAVGALNHKRVTAQNEELARALRAKDGVNDDVAGAQRDTPLGAGPKVGAQEKASYERAGFVYDPKEKVYKKKLPSGKFLIKDPVTKQQTMK